MDLGGGETGGAAVDDVASEALGEPVGGAMEVLAGDGGVVDVVSGVYHGKPYGRGGVLGEELTGGLEGRGNVFVFHFVNVLGLGAKLGIFGEVVKGRGKFFLGVVDFVEVALDEGGGAVGGEGEFEFVTGVEAARDEVGEGGIGEDGGGKVEGDVVFDAGVDEGGGGDAACDGEGVLGGGEGEGAVRAFEGGGGGLEGVGEAGEWMGGVGDGDGAEVEGLVEGRGGVVGEFEGVGLGLGGLVSGGGVVFVGVDGLVYAVEGGLGAGGGVGVEEGDGEGELSGGCGL